MSSIGARSTGNGRRQWITRSAVAIAAISSLSPMAGVSVAQAAPSTVRKATVVHVVRRHPFAKILTTDRSRTLYILPKGSCNAACIGIWPVLLMPRGTNFPKGTPCLGTARFGDRLQVTYRGKRLYLFTGDSGRSATGNNFQGFKVAKLVRKSCPM